MSIDNNVITCASLHVCTVAIISRSPPFDATVHRFQILFLMTVNNTLAVFAFLSATPKASTHWL